MLRFEWEDSYSVGIETIDVQHREIIVIMNDLHLAMVQGKGKLKVEKLLKKLLDYTSSHFSFEEKYLNNMGYRGLKEHKMQHAEFVGKITSFYNECINPRLGLPIDVMKYLKVWFDDHVLVEDKKYANL